MGITCGLLRFMIVCLWMYLDAFGVINDNDEFVDDDDDDKMQLLCIGMTYTDVTLSFVAELVRSRRSRAMSIMAGRELMKLVI